MFTYLQLKKYFGYPDDYTQDDIDNIMRFETLAVSEAERIIERVIEKRSVSHTMLVTGNVAFLKNVPIDESVGITAVDTDGTTYTVTILNAEQGKIKLSSEINLDVKFTYTGGYATVPADLQNAILEMIEYYRKRQVDIGIMSKTTDSGINVSLENSLPYNVKRILESYRLMRA